MSWHTDRITALRKELGWSRAHFARTFGIPYRTAETWEQSGAEHRTPPEWAANLLIEKMEKIKAGN